uniref:RNase H type-1 domain-containing protein n=1 Tax=Chromera velia CCMP2878 TaxID=1169474 RepID=A0A0G4FI80_9ALVE|eukprot:Cvel_17085.t1-p1 / transcript=Cvel_17085.t1 / gene=Cvel_17085 / organism=Chromera_velia_CCMP2878 / gene_product=hypothetical protein / transcript_product=hypothetical protein / location=Cvel_scaffold1347:8714-14732(+) / protein_length=97 / sequence_SO=supercontig / SO=protein_coding / is_pseudo=false
MWGLKKVRLIVYTDSGALHDQFRTGKAQTDATMQGVLEWCIQEMRVLGADLQWIARSRNVANVMTKYALPGHSLGSPGVNPQVLVDGDLGTPAGNIH